MLTDEGGQLPWRSAAPHSGDERGSSSQRVSPKEPSGIGLQSRSDRMEVDNAYDEAPEVEAHRPHSLLTHHLLHHHPSYSGSRQTQEPSPWRELRGPPPLGKSDAQAPSPNSHSDFNLPPASHPRAANPPQDGPATTRRPMAPPPLAPYVSPEKRIHPPPITHWKETRTDSASSRHARYLPQRSYPPPYEHRRPQSSCWYGPRTSAGRGSDELERRTEEDLYRGADRDLTNDEDRMGESRTGIATTSSRFATPFQAEPPDPAAHDMSRSYSSTSHQSQGSSGSRPSTGASAFPSGPEPGTLSGPVAGFSRVEAELETSPTSGQPSLHRRKRTRALMTRMQQQYLKGLWRKTRFPSNAEREELGTRIGLTPRQVQVWFQNQRQKHRKELAETGIPEGADPVEYADLQKSPRSRRRSQDEVDIMERVSAWAGETSVSISTSSSASAVASMSSGMPGQNLRSDPSPSSSLLSPLSYQSPGSDSPTNLAPSGPSTAYARDNPSTSPSMQQRHSYRQSAVERTPPHLIPEHHPYPRPRRSLTVTSTLDIIPSSGTTQTSGPSSLTTSTSLMHSFFPPPRPRGALGLEMEVDAGAGAGNRLFTPSNRSEGQQQHTAMRLETTSSSSSSSRFTSSNPLTLSPPFAFSLQPAVSSPVVHASPLTHNRLWHPSTPQHQHEHDVKQEDNYRSPGQASHTRSRSFSLDPLLAVLSPSNYDQPHGRSLAPPPVLPRLNTIASFSLSSELSNNVLGARYPMYEPPTTQGGQGSSQGRQGNLPPSLAALVLSEPVDAAAGPTAHSSRLAVPGGEYSQEQGHGQGQSQSQRPSGSQIHTEIDTYVPVQDRPPQASTIHRPSIGRRATIESGEVVRGRDAPNVHKHHQWVPPWATPTTTREEEGDGERMRSGSTNLPSLSALLGERGTTLHSVDYSGQRQER